MEQATELIAVLQDKVCVFANSAAKDVLGWEPEEVVGREPEMFVHPEDISTLMEAYERRISGQSHSEVLPYRIFTKDGRLKWMELATRVVDWEGRPALQVFFRDITERKKAEEERTERLNRVERQQAAIVQVAGMAPLVEGDFQARPGASPSCAPRPWGGPRGHLAVQPDRDQPGGQRPVRRRVGPGTKAARSCR